MISGNIDLLNYFEDTFSMSPNRLSTEKINGAFEKINNTEMFTHLLTKYRGFRLGLNEKTTEIVEGQVI